METRAAGIRFHWWVVVLLVVGLAVVGAGVSMIAPGSRGPDPQLIVAADHAEIAAGGAAAHLTIRSPLPDGMLPWAHGGLTARVVEGGHSARIARTYFDAGAWHVTVQSKAMPGKVKIAATLAPFADGSASITVAANYRDSAGDGTPDVLRLEDPADEAAFRGWFTFLAEAQFFRETSTLPAEISDCAGLIRYAYREALRTHDSAWSKSAALPLVPAIPSVRKYEYPFTPWGAALFRIGPEQLAEFADAATLLHLNTHLVARDIRRARAGDLIFFHREDAAMPYHTMMYLGSSQIENAAGPYLIYHTGPTHEVAHEVAHEPGHASSAGEIRRPAVAELQKHPDPSWHPGAENPHFLGVYRWNILWR